MKKRKRTASRDKILLDIIKKSDEQLMLDEKGTVIIPNAHTYQSLTPFHLII